MARPLVIGNGRMLVCLDERAVVRDLYYPRVGQVNHIVGERNQLGLWVDGMFAWLSDPHWEKQLRYRKDSLVTQVSAVHEPFGLEMVLCDAVHPQADILLRSLSLRNRLDRPREARLFATFDFDIGETDMGDTALWDPQLRTILHYKRNQWFLIGGQGVQGGIAQYATGRKRFQGSEGTWRDAEDGVLEGHPISQGSVDSTIGLEASLESRQSVDLHIWVVCDRNYQRVKQGHQQVLEVGPEAMLNEVDGYWRGWVRSGQPESPSAPLPPALQEAFHRSLLIVRTQVDNDGAVIAANDTDILAYNRDHYSYMWPRDGAFVAASLDRAGYGGLTRAFYRFCAAGLSDDGFLWHKYNPDGSVGSSWHPWVGVKGEQLPIQEDETALVLWALGHHYRRYRDHEFIGSLYTDLIRPAADFLTAYRDPLTNLPKESYDLWEERRGIFTFTVAAVIAGLKEAGSLAAALGDNVRAKEYQRAAAQTKTALLSELWSEEAGCFLRGIYTRRDGSRLSDDTLDSSIMGVFLLDVLPVDDPRIVATMRRLEHGLRVKTPVSGLARYQNDYYFRVTDDSGDIPGNPWFICTLWLARWHIARARTTADLQPAYELIEWAMRHALPSGAFPEQVHPLTGDPLSVVPLTWSHATMTDVLLDLADRTKAIQAE